MLQLYLSHFAGQECSAFQLSAISQQAALDGMEGEDPELFLRLDRPAPGLAHVMVMGMGEQTVVSMRFHLYGDQGAAVAADAQAGWTDWLAGRTVPAGGAAVSPGVPRRAESASV